MTSFKRKLLECVFSGSITVFSLHVCVPAYSYFACVHCGCAWMQWQKENCWFGCFLKILLHFRWIYLLRCMDKFSHVHLKKKTYENFISVIALSETSRIQQKKNDRNSINSFRDNLVIIFPSFLCIRWPSWILMLKAQLRQWRKVHFYLSLVMSKLVLSLKWRQTGREEATVG